MDQCCKAFLRGSVQKFGLPQEATSDNVNTFVADIWRKMHEAFGIKVVFTPLYHSSSLGGVERKHRNLKLGLKASLHQMADESRSQWMSRLPWVMLGRRPAFQPELNATATELVFRSNPLLPGDIVGEPGPPLNRTQLETLLEASN